MSKNRTAILKDPPLPPSGGDPRRKGLILIVEDDPDISKMLRIYFDSQGYETVIEKLSANVVEIAIQNLPDMIILAMSLPDDEGDQLYGALQANPKTQQIPVLLLPEEEEAQGKLDALDLKENDQFISKPFDIEKLKQAVERVIPKDPYAPGSILWQAK